MLHKIPIDLLRYPWEILDFMAQHGKPASNIRGRVRAMNGEFSGGTAAASLSATMASLKEKPELFAVLANPFSLSNGFTGPEQAPDSKPVYDEKLETWVAPFFMALADRVELERVLHHLKDHVKDFVRWLISKANFLILKN